MPAYRVETSFPFLLSAVVTLVIRTVTELLNLEAIYSNVEQQYEVIIGLGKQIATHQKVFGVFDTICIHSNVAEDILRDRWTCTHYTPI